MHNMDNDIDHILVPEEELKAKVTALGRSPAIMRERIC